MAATNASTILSLVALTVAAGCKGKGDPIVGKWTDFEGAEIVFKADNSFSQGTGSTSGKWAFSDGKLTVTLEKIGGVPAVTYFLKNSSLSLKDLTATELAVLRQQTSGIVLILSKDGKKLAPADPMLSPVRTLTKVEAK